MVDPAIMKSIIVAAFNGGVIWGTIRAGHRKQREEVASLKRRVARLRRYQEWSHRALSIIISHHAVNHPGQGIIDDWHGGEENENGS